MQIRKAIQPLARKLQARLARKRRHLRRGALDFRSTMRHSLSYGGVPAEPRFRHPKPTKPEIFVIADISGSAAAFARFTLHLVHAIAAQFSQVRSFVFIDGIDEVTQIFERSETVGEAIHRAEPGGRRGLGGRAQRLRARPQRVPADVGSRRRPEDEHHPARRRQIQLPRPGGLDREGAASPGQARLLAQPEPRSYWGSGDSIIEQYAQFCDGVYECRNLRQLEGFVEHLV